MAMSKIWGYLGCMQMGFSGVFLKSPFPIKTRHHHHLGEFFCTIWLIRQLTNEGWFVSLLPENVSIFRPSFFSISSPSRMSLTSRPNICYYYLGVYVSWTRRGQATTTFERLKIPWKIIKECTTYNLFFVLTWRRNPEVLHALLWRDFWNAVLKKPSANLWWIHTWKKEGNAW